MGVALRIPGPVLVGFAEMFDRAYGDPRTPRPYPKVTPTRIGSTLLPFPCPHCGEAQAEPVDRKRRENYTDPERGFSWCFSCTKRFVVNPDGVPLADALPAGATAAPALVDRGEGDEELKPAEPSGLDLLGAEPARGRRRRKR